MINIITKKEDYNNMRKKQSIDTKYSINSNNTIAYKKLKRYYSYFILILLLLFATIMLYGCGKPEPDIINNNQQFERTEIKLSVKLFDNERELNQYIVDNFNVKDANRLGFSKWYLDDVNNECTIYVVRGTKTSLQSTYGHEIMHCIYGTYHKE